MGTYNKLVFECGVVNVLKQTRTPPNSDYVPPPPGYNLINVNGGFQFPIRKTTANIELACTNSRIRFTGII